MDGTEIVARIIDGAYEATKQDTQELVRPLREYDAAHGGDLYRTLATYLALGCNASRTSSELYLHRSGLLYRLSRIQLLLGLNLDDFEVRTALSVAVQAEK